MDQEVWEQDDEASNYEVSNKGRVRNEKTKKIIKPFVNEIGDEVVHLYSDGKRITRKVSRLVAKHYLESDLDGKYVKHKDRNKGKNHANNLYVKSKKSGKRIQILETGEVFESLEECSKRLGMSKSYLSKCVNYPFYKNKKGYHFKILD